MSENVSLAANKSRQHYHTSGSLTTDCHMHVNVSTGSSDVPASTPRVQAKPKRPFLQRGSGLKRRQQASMSDKRYIPKGGFVLDFAADAIAPHPMGNGNMHHKAVPKRTSPSPAASRRVQDPRMSAAVMRASSPVRRAGTDANVISSSSISRRWPAAALAQPASRDRQPTTAPRGASRQEVSLHAPAPAGVRTLLPPLAPWL